MLNGWYRNNMNIQPGYDLCDMVVLWHHLQESYDCVGTDGQVVSSHLLQQAKNREVCSIISQGGFPVRVQKQQQTMDADWGARENAEGF